MDAGEWQAATAGRFAGQDLTDRSTRDPEVPCLENRHLLEKRGHSKIARTEHPRCTLIPTD